MCSYCACIYQYSYYCWGICYLLYEGQRTDSAFCVLVSTNTFQLWRFSIPSLLCYTIYLSSSCRNSTVTFPVFYMQFCLFDKVEIDVTIFWRDGKKLSWEESEQYVIKGKYWQWTELAACKTEGWIVLGVKTCKSIFPINYSARID